jgi:hypothetical protein
MQDFFFDLLPPGQGLYEGVAATIPSPPIRSIVDAKVILTSRIKGASTDLLFQTRLVTPVAYPGRLQIDVPPNFTLDEDCVIRPRPGQLAWHSHEALGFATCAWQNVTRKVFIGPYPGKPIPSGLLQWRINATNPETKPTELGPCGGLLCWRFSTFSNGANSSYIGNGTCNPVCNGSNGTYFPPVWIGNGTYGIRVAQRYAKTLSAMELETMSVSNVGKVINCSNGGTINSSDISEGYEWSDDIYCGGPLDAPILVAGSDLDDPMFEAELLSFRPSGRDDRPSRPTVLVFRFKLRGPKQMAIAEAEIGGVLPPLPVGDLHLTGPPGFVFAQMCRSVVELRRNEIFGLDATAKQKWNVDVWNPKSTVIRCDGSDNYAVIRIAAGLRYNLAYAFSIAMRNPPLLAPENSWTISFQNFSSKAFPSFELWTFGDMGVVPLSLHSGPSCYMGNCIGAGLGIPVPVTLSFKVLNRIDTGGELLVTAPVDFAWAAIEEVQEAFGDLPAPCAVWQYWTGNFSETPEKWRDSDRECLLVYRGSALLGTGTGDKQTLRVRLTYLYNEFEPRAPRSFLPESTYKILAYIYPPAGYRPPEVWKLETRSAPADGAAEGLEVDVGSFMGYEVRKVLLTFRHTNQEYNWHTNTVQGVQTAGMTLVKDFVFELELSENAFPEDSLVLIAPPGFKLQREALGSCRKACECISTKFIMPARITAPEVIAEAFCEGETLTLPLRGLDTAMQARQKIRWWLELTNAEVPSAEGTNYWIIKQVNSFNSLVAAAVARSWPIVPTITGVFSEITGIKRAAGALTELTFNFHSLLKASEIKITALQPEGFSFDDCFVKGVLGGTYVPYLQIIQQIVVKESLRKSNTVQIVANLEARQNNTLIIENVHLSLIADISRWSITTYELSLAKQDYGTPYIRDEVYFHGFGVPGRITVKDISAKTFVTTLRGIQLFTSAVLGGGKSNVTLQIVVSAQLFTDDIIFMSFKATDAKNEPELNSEGFRIQQNGVAEMEPDAPGFPVKPTAIKAGFMAERALAFSIGEDIAQGVTIAFTLPSFTPTNRLMLSWEGILVEVYRGGYTPDKLIATNDEAKIVLPVVTLLPNDPPPAVVHAPPLVPTEAAFQLDPKDTEARYMIITAPTGFSFPGDCMAPSEANVNLTTTGARCLKLMEHESVPVPPGSRARARLDCHGEGGEPGLDCLLDEVVTVLVVSPDATPEKISNIWDVEAMNYLGGELRTFGRAELPGFNLVAMDATVTYASLADVPVDVCVSFKTRVDVPAQGTVVIVAPANLASFGCFSAIRGRFSPLSLGAVQRCIEGDFMWNVTLVLNESLPAGIHSVSIPGTTALLEPKPSQNLFDVYVRGPDGQNLDVALSIPGETVRYGLRANVWPARFRMGVDRSEAIKVFLPIEVLDKADVYITGIFVSLPKEPDMRIIGKTMKINTFYGSQTNLLESVVSTDGTSVFFKLDGNSKLNMDVYQILLEVSFPTQQPQYNVWRIALCNETFPDLNNGGCDLPGLHQSLRGPAVFSVFALAGFDPFKAKVNLAPPMVGGAQRLMHTRRLWLVALGSLATLVEAVQMST